MNFLFEVSVILAIVVDGSKNELNPLLKN